MRNGSRESISILHRRLEKPLLALQAALDGAALIKAVFRLTKSASRCDFVNVFLRIARKGEGNVAYQMIDSRGREFGPELLENVFFHEHPAMPTLMANTGIKFINTREILPPDATLHKTRFYREVMQVMGFRHAIGIFFWDDPSHTPEAIFSLCRGEGQPDFDDVEVALLARLHPHIDAALRRVRAIEQERAVHAELRTLVRRASRAACALDWNLVPAGVSRAARESCAQWNLGAAGARLKTPPFRLPHPLREACAELKAQWRASFRENRVAGSLERRRVRHPARPSLHATVSMHLHHMHPFARPGFLIEFEPAMRASSAVGRNTSRHRLTTDESLLVELVREGRSNQEIAEQTGKALGSVKNALHALFKKEGVRSRSALTAQVGRKRG